jgi:hypothetical protein
MAAGVRAHEEQRLSTTSHRAGLHFDMDEALYLQRTVRDAAMLDASGLGGLWPILRIPGPEAPHRS